MQKFNVSPKDGTAVFMITDTIGVWTEGVCMNQKLVCFVPSFVTDRHLVLERKFIARRALDIALEDSEEVPEINAAFMERLVRAHSLRDMVDVDFTVEPSKIAVCLPLIQTPCTVFLLVLHRTSQ